MYINIRNTVFCFLFIFMIFLFVNCEKKQYGSYLDLEDLEKIEVTLDIEIGSEDKYIFGRIRDIIVQPDSTMIVSDLGKKTIVQFNAIGKFVGTVAKQGMGPGEVSTFFNLHDGGEDTLFVQHRGMRQHIDLFVRKHGDVLFTYRSSIKFSEFTNRVVSIIGKRGISEYYANATQSSQNLEQSALSFPYGKSMIVIVDSSKNILQDSLHVLKSPNSLSHYSQNSMFVIGMPPYQSRDRFRLFNNNRYIIARPDSGKIYIYNRDHTIEDTIDIKMRERPVKISDLEYHLQFFSKRYHNEVKDRIPDFKPPFLNVWVSEDKILLHIDSTVHGKSMILLAMNGEPIGRFTLTEYDKVNAFMGNRIYTIHKDQEKGDRIRVYRI